VLGAIGSTPLIQVDGISSSSIPQSLGSIKARMARYIIERAEREGLLNPATPSRSLERQHGNAMSMVAPSWATRLSS